MDDQGRRHARVHPTFWKNARAIAMILDLRKMSSLPVSYASHASEATSRTRADASRSENRTCFDASISSTIFRSHVTLVAVNEIPARSRSRNARLIEGSRSRANFRRRRLLEYSRSTRRLKATPRAASEPFVTELSCESVGRYWSVVRSLRIVCPNSDYGL